MFGKIKESSATTDTDERAELDVTIDDFFGDEGAVAEASRVDLLQDRVTQVEQQISSQFTSLAAYAQIAQEQVELVRSEAQHSNERSEQRVIGLIERERSDRLSSSTGGGTDVSARLDCLDAQVAEIRSGLEQCLSNQKALADAIRDLFTPPESATDSRLSPDPTPGSATNGEGTAMPAPTVSSPNTTLPPPPVAAIPLDHDTDNVGDEQIREPELVESPETDTTDAASRDLVEIEPIGTSTDLVDGPIDGLSLA